MNTASRVISKFGSQSDVAEALGKARSTVSYWSRTGVIPAKWQGPLLDLAKRRGIELSPGDFVDMPRSDSDIEQQRAVPPEARWPGVLAIGDTELPVYVLDDGRRVISRTGATRVLAGPQGGGDFEGYLTPQAMRVYLPQNLHEQMVEFSIAGVVNKTVLGMTAETFLDICRAYAQARDDGALRSPVQERIAVRAGMFLAACAKVGLIALIDESTGYQYERAQDALQLKMKLYLEDEMRQWEKTFPDELWREFGRLTNWKGTLHQRPKYWGRFVMELVYEYLDPDVADWLKKNNPKPQHRQNYHQWLSSQYGLKKLVEHLWMLIGMASACQSMPELRKKMAEKYGRIPVQWTLFVAPPDLPRLPKRDRRTDFPGDKIRVSQIQIESVLALESQSLSDGTSA